MQSPQTWRRPSASPESGSGTPLPPALSLHRVLCLYSSRYMVTAQEGHAVSAVGPDFSSMSPPEHIQSLAHDGWSVHLVHRSR